MSSLLLGGFGGPKITSSNFNFSQYLTVNEAMEYFCQRLNSNVWYNSSLSNQNAALIQSTTAIDNLNYLGTKLDPNQVNEFPRWQPSPSTQAGLPAWWNGGFYFSLPAPPYTPVTEPIVTPVVPQEILIAVCENAIVLLDGFDFELEIKNLYTIKSEYAAIRETYDRTIAVTQLRSGIASARAWTLLQPWLADTKSFTISRAN
jgi:hypothetical protein